MSITSCLAMWAVLGLPALATAQRIYNQAQDEKAAAAVALGRQFAVSSAFDKAVSNLAELQKLRNEDIFRSGRLLMKAEMGSWRTWEDLDASIRRFEADLTREENGGDTQAELKAAREKEAQAQAEFAELALRLTADATPEALNVAGDWMQRIAGIKPLADYLAGLEKDAAAGKLHVKAAGQAKASLETLAKLYQDFKLELPPKPSSLFMQSKLEELELEVRHLENVIGIQQRLDAELKDIRSILNTSLKAIAAIKPAFPAKTIQESLDSQAAAAKASGGAETEKLSDMLFLLYNASALAARSRTPIRLAEGRETLEQRAHALRRAGASSAAYEAILVNGLERLSLYYKGGIKASALADLIQAFATVGIIPAIAAK